MADLVQYPHAEDVIFNKPSLKELIRLIKNGSISAIWPSTQEEFDWWNETGYLLYDKGEPLKTIKTAMTIFYGDHEDSSATKTLDVSATTSKYNEILNYIQTEKQKLVDELYYDDINDIYPDDINLTSSSLDSSTGVINNANNFINYKRNIISNYQNYLLLIEDFISRIENFDPENTSSSYTISDENFFDEDQEYHKYFKDIETDLNDKITAIQLKNTLTENEINDILTTDGYYDFTKLNTFYSEDLIKIQNIISFLSQYYNQNSNNILSQDSYINCIDDIQSIENKYQNFLEELKTKIDTFIDDWKEETNNGLQTLKSIQIAPIISADYSEDNRKKYLNDEGVLQEVFYTDFINDYKNLVLQKNTFQTGVIDIDAANTYWYNLLYNFEQQVLINGQNNFDLIINILNNSFYKAINTMYIRDSLFVPIDSNIKILANGEIDQQEQIVQQLNNLISLLTELQQVIDNYVYLLNLEDPDGLKISITPYVEQNQEILNFLSQKTTAKEDGKTEIQQDQSAAIIYITNLINEYNNFITIVKNKNFISVNYPQTYQIDETNKVISNLSDMITAVLSQQEIANNYYQMFINSFDYDNTLISNLNQKTTSITQKLNSLYVIENESGTGVEFEEQVIQEDFNINTINLLLKRITKSTLSFSEHDIIPVLSGDLLTIENKETVLSNLERILGTGISLNRTTTLEYTTNNINQKLIEWYPIYILNANSHYICIASGSDIQFPNEIENSDLSSELDEEEQDGSITIQVDGEYHYPLINNIADDITDNTRKTQILSVSGLIRAFGGDPEKKDITDISMGNTYTPVYISKGKFKTCPNVIQGTFSDSNTKIAKVQYWEVKGKVNGSMSSTVGLKAKKLFGAVYNDYAEYRNTNAKPGQCVIENGDGSLSPSTKRLQLGANIVSDTYGFAIGETNNATCPIAVSGRVLALPLEDKILYTPGAAVCSGPNGTISLMSREEIREWPDAIVGFVSEVPTYNTWGSDNVPVNGRIWIKIK